MYTDEIMRKLSAHILGSPEHYAHFGGSIKMTVPGAGGGSWIFFCRGNVRVEKSTADADCELELSREALAQIVEHHSNPQALFREGKILVRGDTQLALHSYEILTGSV